MRLPLPRPPGFTLIEVLVALSMVAIALMAGLRAVGSMMQTNTELRLRLLAQLSAENRVAVVRASRAFPALGVRTLPCPQAEARLVCDEEIKATPNIVFRRIEVKVHEEDNPFILAQLTAIVPDGL